MELERILVLTLSSFFSCLLYSQVYAAETILSTVLTPDTKLLSRQSRSYYDPRVYAVGLPYDGRAYEYARPYEYGRPERPYYEYARLEYDRPRCGRCDDRYDRDRDRDRDDRDDDRRDRDGYDDRKVNHRPTYGNRYDRNKNDDDENRYSDDRNHNSNSTDDDNDTDKKRPYDDKDSRPSGSRKDRDRSKYDDRDRYRPDYYDRFLRDPGRERDRDRGYGDPYRERRPLYDRYPDRYDDGYASRYDPYLSRYDGYGGYRRPLYDDRYDRGYDDGYGGYGPGVGRGPHDRPWDETYRGQAGWDAGGRGYYFASGRPDTAPAPSWNQPGYVRPQESGWQNIGYTGYRDPLEYRGSLGYQEQGYRQDLSTAYGQGSGWHSVGERRPYRDQSGVSHLDDRNTHKPNRDQNNYGQPAKQGYGQQNTYGQSQNTYGQSQNTYGQPQNAYGQSQNNYGVNNAYGQKTATNIYSSSTTPSTSYLFQRLDERVTTKTVEETTKTPS
ncbi:uncharacterized protein DDB_G0283697 isoform X2 [Plodia interpunctella]|uniref:uncharacterized protein DDB_G0283697 isoform X2 n=1 Tax=Plodia interpunctella TaxID=58824 RepID=UPI0023679ED3|nr:uncharacterized protein DDB_G0283697 isoform X2 [Plodia interpunctella]